MPLGPAARRSVAWPRAERSPLPALVGFCGEIQPSLLGALTLYTGDREMAQELAQETLARVVIHWSKISRMESPAAWAHRVAVNLAHSAYRRAAASRRALARLEDLPGSAGAEDATVALTLRQAVAALPLRQKTAVVLRFYADLPVREVASIMRCAEGTVSALVHQGVANLRRNWDLDSLEMRDV